MKICLDCGRISSENRCPPCKSEHQRRRDIQRGTTTQRGLGAAHQRQIRELKRETGPLTYCPRCGREITAANPITGEHTTARAHGGRVVDGLVCRRCNSSMGARIRRS